MTKRVTRRKLIKWFQQKGNRLSTCRFINLIQHLVLPIQKHPYLKKTDQMTIKAGLLEMKFRSKHELKNMI